MPVDITLGTLTFRGTSSGARDANGCLWTWTELIGWEAAPVRTHLAAKVLANGSILVENQLDHRPLVLKGRATASSYDNRWVARNDLEGVLNGIVTANGTLTVAEPAGNKTLTVRYTGRADVREFGRFTFFFEIPLVAANPAKA